MIFGKAHITLEKESIKGTELECETSLYIIKIKIKRLPLMTLQVVDLVY